MEPKEANETIADIVAEMRYGTIPKHRTDHELLALYADRIEAAWKRESKAIATENAVLPAVCITKSVGNAAAMREAMLQVALSCSACPRHNCKGCTRPFASFMPAVRKALSTPPRNCDKYRDYESLCRAWENAVRVEGITFGKWLFAPATEWKGEGDGK